MGAYLSKPVIEKASEGGEYSTASKKIIYGATAMQGWRMAMEDAHCIITQYDEGSSFFGVYDGHGGREVAVYCATHLADIIKSSEAYSQGDLKQAMKDAFMKCDRLVTEREAIEEMKTYDEDEMKEEADQEESEGELENLLEESSMPLQSLLARYSASTVSTATADDERTDNEMKRQGISSILQLLTRSPDVECEDSESENEESEGDDLEENETLPDAVSSPSGHIEELSEKTSEDSISPTSNHSELDKINTCSVENSDTNSSNTNSKSDSNPLKTDSKSIKTDADKQVNRTLGVLKKRNSTPKFESKSLMDLLTTKPMDKPVVNSNSTSSPRKRLYLSGVADCTSPKKQKKMDKQGYHSGTTAIIGILREDEFVVANAGDSKCIIASKGKAIDMSFDHKPTDQRELHRIINAGGHVGPDSRVNGGLNLSRAIGDHFYKENSLLSLEDQMISAMPDIKSVPITSDEQFIVFACDGIWNSKSSQEVVDFVCCRLKEKVGNGTPTQQDLTQICESLCDACLAADTDNDGTGCDNMTCIIVFLS